MRRRLNWLVLAVTGLLVVAFVIPLGLLVRRQAVEGAQIAAEQRAQAVAAALAVAAAAEGEITLDRAETALVADAAIVLPDGGRAGTVAIPESLIEQVRSGRAASQTTGDGAWTIGLPVAIPEGIVTVAARAEATEMTAGVWQAVLLLALLAVALMGGSVALADRLGRSLVDPARDLAIVANRLAEGDLGARAAESGPPEIRRIGQALNGLAARLERIITGEREALADLSHRLRTPLTALRLEAERFQAGESPERILAQVDRVQRAVDQLIREVRSRGSHQEQADVTEVVENQLAFWSVLADDQGRAVDWNSVPGPLLVPTPASDLAAAVDAVIGNVFQHTPAGTGFSVRVHSDSGTPLITVIDEGPGLPSDPVIERGTSPGGSTGLGLDIARGLCQRLGGDLHTGEGPGGGALVRMRLGR
ncbi:MAG TPA: HAMP domain-containing sensor histidine kinase [Acidimicrobiia bacterium]|nr:HAMP domain-containing sensor histidine kinase [Acidimicrobiia bacterium]